MFINLLRCQGIDELSVSSFNHKGTWRAPRKLERLKS
jgi:hypothetical protein